MQLIDLVILVLLLGSVLRGQELGFIRQIFSTIGFFTGLLVGILLQPYALKLAHTPVTRIGTTIGVTFGCALLVLSLGELIGQAIKQHLQFRNWLDHADNAFGAILAALSSLIIVWLSAVVLVTLPYPNIQATVHSSKIVSFLDRHLPTAPNVVADVGHLIAPNGFPNVFIGGEPSSAPATLPTPEALMAAVAQDRASIVKIEGQGCGGIVEGSGFVVGTNLIATNAHVVAGIEEPYVIDGNGTHSTTPIWFDPNLDFAVLQVNHLAGKPLTFNTNAISHGTPGGVLGYPGGGPFTADTAAVLDEFTAVGRNIYNAGRTTRDVYSVQANIVPGNSGGPLVDLNGTVIGIVFAASTTTDNTGYALSSPQIVSELHQAVASNQPTATGSCAE